MLPQRRIARTNPRRPTSLWITCGLLWTTCGAPWVTAGCGDDSSRETAAQSAPAAVENPADHQDEAEPGPREPELEPLPEDLPEPSPREQLEADCFAGDQAACDQLGH